MSPNLPSGRPQRASLYAEPAARGFLRRYVGWIALALIVLVSGFLGYVVWTLRDLPDPGQQPVLGRSIVIYDRQGRQIEQRNANGQYYVQLQLQQMGHWGPAATLAAEDRNFYHHGAIDFAGTARAAAADIIHGGAEQGGSTITQQLIKISVLTPQRSVLRKSQEAVLAVGLEQRYSKDRILEMYLN
nr:transglycosylase domain-containing protein [Candidatus Dormibacteraeota bacterium]